MAKIITYYAPNDSMGDTSNADCERFRAWARNEIENRFEGYYVRVVDSQSPTQCKVVGSSGLIEDDEIREYVQGLWESCPWTGPFFEV